MLIDGAMTIGYLIAAVRAQLKLEKSESMFINIQNKVFPACNIYIYIYILYSPYNSISLSGLCR